MTERYSGTRLERLRADMAGLQTLAKWHEIERAEQIRILEIGYRDAVEAAAEVCDGPFPATPPNETPLDSFTCAELGQRIRALGKEAPTDAKKT